MLSAFVYMEDNKSNTKENIGKLEMVQRLVFPPAPKKVAKKGHFLARGSMSKGHFQPAKGTFKWPMTC